MNKQLNLDDVQPKGTVISKGKALMVIPEEDADRKAEFDWLKDESIMVPEQQAIAAYYNRKGELVIRQERSWCDDEDSFIVIHGGNVHAFLDKLCDVIGIPSVGGPEPARRKS